MFVVEASSLHLAVQSSNCHFQMTVEKFLSTLEWKKKENYLKLDTSSTRQRLDASCSNFGSKHSLIACPWCLNTILLEKSQNLFKKYLLGMTSGHLCQHQQHMRPKFMIITRTLNFWCTYNDNCNENTNNCSNFSNMSKTS